MLCGNHRGQDFEKAGQLRDKEMELKAQISAITAGAKESGEAEQEAEGGGGPLVQESDIANIVAQWTGIPIEKVRLASLEQLVASCHARQLHCFMWLHVLAACIHVAYDNQMQTPLNM